MTLGGTLALCIVGIRVAANECMQAFNCVTLCVCACALACTCVESCKYSAGLYKILSASCVCCATCESALHRCNFVIFRLNGVSIRTARKAKMTLGKARLNS